MAKKRLYTIMIMEGLHGQSLGKWLDAIQIEPGDLITVEVGESESQHTMTVKRPLPVTS